MCTLAAGRARGKHGIPLGGRGKGWLMKVATVPASPKWGGGGIPAPLACKCQNQDSVSGETKLFPSQRQKPSPYRKLGRSRQGGGEKGLKCTGWGQAQVH